MPKRKDPFDFTLPDFKSDLIDSLGTGNVDSKDTPDPFAEIEYTHNVEKDSQAEMSAVLKAFRERAKNDKIRQDYMTSSEFFTCIVFQSKAQRDAFINFLGIKSDDNQYIDGLQVAEKLGIKLPACEYEYRPGKIDGKLANLVK